MKTTAQRIAPLSDGSTQCATESELLQAARLLRQAQTATGPGMFKQRLAHLKEAGEILEFIEGCGLLGGVWDAVAGKHISVSPLNESLARIALLESSLHQADIPFDLGPLLNDYWHFWQCTCYSFERDQDK